MLKLRCSATDIDAFRYWRDNDPREDQTPEEALAGLLAQLRREAPPSEPMLAGKALHKALEHSGPGEVSTLEADGYLFHIAAEVELELTPIRELKAELGLVVDGVLVTLVGVVDGIDGHRVDDHKFTGRFEPERFLDSYQWRIYLLIFNAHRFRWNVFECSQTNLREYRIFGAHRLEQAAYPGMRDDVLRELREFIAFARVHLPERFLAEAA